MVGYVSTDYGNRAAAEVEQDVKTYNAWASSYAVEGIFFDEVKDGISATYQAYSDYVKELWPSPEVDVSRIVDSRKLSLNFNQIILNPGTSVGKDLFAFGTQVVTYESPYAGYR